MDKIVNEATLVQCVKVLEVDAQISALQAELEGLEADNAEDKSAYDKVMQTMAD